MGIKLPAPMLATGDTVVYRGELCRIFNITTRTHNDKFVEWEYFVTGHGSVPESDLIDPPTSNEAPVYCSRCQEELLTVPHTPDCMNCERQFECYVTECPKEVSHEKEDVSTLREEGDQVTKPK